MLACNLLKSILISTFSSLLDLYYIRIIVYLFKQFISNLGRGIIVVKDSSRDVISGLIIASFDMFNNDIKRA